LRYASGAYAAFSCRSRSRASRRNASQYSGVTSIGSPLSSPCTSRDSSRSWAFGFSAIVWLICSGSPTSLPLPPSHPGLPRALRDRPRHAVHDLAVEDAGDDVVFVELVGVDDGGDGAGGRELHRLVDAAGVAVEGAAEHAGEAEDVVD